MKKLLLLLFAMLGIFAVACEEGTFDEQNPIDNPVNNGGENQENDDNNNDNQDNVQTAKIPNNEIWYTTSNGETCLPNSYAFDVSIQSNTYVDGKGVITFYENVTKIKDNCFIYPYSLNLTSVTLPNSITEIGKDAFEYCSSNLSSINIPDSVTTIGESAFDGCGIISVTIPDSVTSIGEYAFSSCSQLTNVIIGDGVTEIPERAFEGCHRLENIKFGKNVKTIGNKAFHECCYGLESVDIPDSVTTIGWEAFANCDSLISVTIGKNVTKIVGGAFDLTTDKIKYFYSKAVTPPDASFKSYESTFIFLYVPMESVEAYKTDPDWGACADYIEGYDF